MNYGISHRQWIQVRFSLAFTFFNSLSVFFLCLFYSVILYRYIVCWHGSTTTPPFSQVTYFFTLLLTFTQLVSPSHRIHSPFSRISSAACMSILCYQYGKRLSETASLCKGKPLSANTLSCLVVLSLFCISLIWCSFVLVAGMWLRDIIGVTLPVQRVSL